MWLWISGFAWAGPMDGQWIVARQTARFDPVANLSCGAPYVGGPVVVRGGDVEVGGSRLAGALDGDTLFANGAVGDRPQRWSLALSADGLAGTVTMEAPCAASIEVHLVRDRDAAPPDPITSEPAPTPPVQTSTLWMSLPPVPFKTGTAILPHEAEEPLGKVAGLLRTRPGVKVEIAVYSDATGSDLFNLKLSQDRADAIRDWLVGVGFSRALLVPTGYGEAYPVAPNTSSQGRAMNRRVELRLWP